MNGSPIPEWRMTPGIFSLTSWSIDPGLSLFIDDLEKHGFGGELDTRAGDRAEGDHTDEDSTEAAFVNLLLTCFYTEFGCRPLCTVNHFYPKLPVISPNDAIQHARDYFDVAVKLYKAAKCASSTEKAETYRKWAARALGHAIHLVQDMGSPQHVFTEYHDPLIGHGPSFHENWALEAWENQPVVTYTRPDTGQSRTLGNFEKAAAAAAEPRKGTLESIMDWLAAEGKLFGYKSPFLDRPLKLARLGEILNSSSYQPQWEISARDKDGNPTLYDLPGFVATHFPTYGLNLFGGLKRYSTWPLPDHPDFSKVGWIWPPDHGDIDVESLELAERLWAEADPRDFGRPIQFDEDLKTLITRTTEAAAGVILAFWDEVKDYQCPCHGFTPCSFRFGSKEPDCGKPKPGPHTPGGDNPDDTQGIVSNVTSLTTPSVAQFDSVELGKHWKQIAAVGVEKGLPSLVDFGRTMHLLELAQDSSLTDNGRDEIARGMAEMERKYSLNRPRPEDDMAKAAHVAVLENGFAGEAASALDALGWTHLAVPITFDPLQLAENQKALLIPSGGLYGTSGSADLKERLSAFVEAGGTLIVLAQMLGEDFQTVPVPAGERIKAYGWFEDQSCWGGTVRIATAHPITAALASGGRSVALDGYLEQWPAQATVLLRKTNGGMPALLTYPLGAGWVVVGTIFSDWARGNGRSSAEDESLLGSLLRWGRDPGMERPLCHFGAPCTVTLPVTVRNLTESAADTVVWQVAGNRSWGSLTWSEKHPLAAGEVVTQTISVDLSGTQGVALPSFQPGILTLVYRLEDGTRTVEVKPLFGGNKPWVVQPDAAAGQLVVENWPEDVAHAPAIGVGLAVESEYVVDGSSMPIHLSVHNFGTEPFSGVVKLSTWAKWFPDVPVEVAPESLSTYDLSVGPVHLTTGHDGLPGGGFIQAEVYSATGDGPLATAVKNLLYDPKLFEISLQTSESSAGPGDELHFFGAITNQSMGEVNARYRMTYTNYYSTTGVRCPETKTDWRDQHLGRDERVEFDEPYTVPNECNGIIDATLSLCYPGHRCWDDGNEANATHRSVQVGLPNTVVELSFGEFTVVDGPAFRLPVHVRNIGIRAVENGQVGVVYWNPQGSEVHSGLFNLGRDEETTISFDLPLPTGRALDHYVLHGRFPRQVPASEGG